MDTVQQLRCLRKTQAKQLVKILHQLKIGKVSDQSYLKKKMHNYFSFRSFLEILKLVSSGRMGQAIDLTIRSYPGLFDTNQDLLFMLKCRQFIEMVNGSDFEVISHRTKLIIFKSKTQFFSICANLFISF
jgi:hypothetical protein